MYINELNNVIRLRAYDFHNITYIDVEKNLIKRLKLEQWRQTENNFTQNSKHSNIFCVALYFVYFDYYHL